MHSFKALVLCVGLFLSSAVHVSSARAEARASINIEPLLEAIKNENVETVQRLIRNQNLNVENRRGVKPLSVAVDKDNERITALLIQNGADVNYPKGILKTAVEHGNEKIAELLIQNRVNINTADFLGETALHLAAYKGFERIADLLLKNNANVNHEDVSGKTALHQAAAFVCGIGEALGHSGRKCINHIAREGREKVAELLISNGANVNQKDQQGKTALHLAAEHGHAKVVDLLRKNGADISIVDNRGKTASESASALTRSNSGRNRYVPK